MCASVFVCVCQRDIDGDGERHGDKEKCQQEEGAHTEESSLDEL